MINFRFHIVSLTAVLLALGIGLVLGTTFLDDALEQTLKKQLNDLEASLASARQRNDELTRQLKAYQEESAASTSSWASGSTPDSCPTIPCWWWRPRAS